jgi:hypothetical protein
MRSSRWAKVSQGSYSVHHADITDAENALVRVWSDNLERRDDLHAKYRWYYRSNPLGQGEAFLLNWIDEAGVSHVVGSAGLGRRRFYHAGEPFDTLLLADLAVDKPHRTGRPALSLQRAVQHFARAQTPMTYGFPNEAALGVFLRLGYRQVGQMTTYVRVLRYEPYLRRLPFSRFVAGPGALALDRLSRLGEQRRARVGSLSLRFERSLDARFDQLFQRIRSRYGVIGCRGADFLRWRFFESLDGPAEVATLVEDTTGELKAYVVTTRGKESAVHIVDFLGAEEDLDVLFGRLVPELRAQGFVSIRLFFMGGARVARLLRSHGFRKRESKPIVIDLAQTLPFRTEMLDPEVWHLTRADEDN